MDWYMSKTIQDRSFIFQNLWQVEKWYWTLTQRDPTGRDLVLRFFSFLCLYLNPLFLYIWTIIGRRIVIFLSKSDIGYCRDILIGYRISDTGYQNWILVWIDYAYKLSIGDNILSSGCYFIYVHVISTWYTIFHALPFNIL